MQKVCYLFDLDGTLADGTHRVHHLKSTPPDWRTYFSKCGDDEPIAHMVHLFRVLTRAGYPVVIVSGRSDEVRAETEHWLARHNLHPAKLVMRKAGDHKPDDVLKMEMLEDLQAEGWLPIMAFDDRNRVVAAWRKAGIPCAQVAEGDF